MTDQEILESIRRNDLERPVRELYRHLPMVKSTLKKYGTPEQQIIEIFNDGIVLLLEKAQAPSFELRSRFSTFLTGICLNYWRNECRRSMRRTTAELDSELAKVHAYLDFDAEREEKLRIMDRVLDTIQERCKTLLKLFYLEKKSMAEIAGMMGFGSEKSAKTQKYKCMEKAQAEAVKELSNLQNTVL